MESSGGDEDLILFGWGMDLARRIKRRSPSAPMQMVNKDLRSILAERSGFLDKMKSHVDVRSDSA